MEGHKNYEVCFRTYQVWTRLQQPPQDRKGIMSYQYFSEDLCFYLFFEGLLYIAEASQTLIAFIRVWRVPHAKTPKCNLFTKKTYAIVRLNLRHIH